MSFVPETVDLAALARALREELAGSVPEGLVPGKTALRDRVLARLGCSELEAEQLVDTLTSRGFVEFVPDPSGSSLQGRWRFC